MKKTPLNAVHRQLGAGWSSSAAGKCRCKYKGIIEEHKAVRQRVGIFDTCHMGEFVVQGSGALPLLQYATTNDVAKLDQGQAQYSFMTQPARAASRTIAWSIASPTTIMSWSTPRRWKPTSPPARLADEQKIGDVTLRNFSDETGKLDIQGPQAAALVQKFHRHRPRADSTITTPRRGR